MHLDPELLLRSAAPRVFRYELDDATAFVHRHSSLRNHLLYLNVIDNIIAPYLTNDAEEADIFFVPLCLICFQFVDVIPRDFPHYPRPLGEYAGALEHLNRGRHVLLATGDFGQRCESRHQLLTEGRAYKDRYSWLDERWNLIAFESTRELFPQDVGMLPAPFVRDPPPVRARFTSRQLMGKDLLYSFAGSMAYRGLPADHARGGRLRELRTVIAKGAFVGDARLARVRYGRIGGSAPNMIQRSIFTLCPAGYRRWTFRLGEALRYGSIPVVLSDDYILPHANFINWKDCVIVVPEKRMSDIPNMLRAMSESEIRIRQMALAEHRPLFTPESACGMALLDLLATLRS